MSDEREHTKVVALCTYDGELYVISTNHKENLNSAITLERNTSGKSYDLLTTLENIAMKDIVALQRYIDRGALSIEQIHETLQSTSMYCAIIQEGDSFRGVLSSFIAFFNVYEPEQIYHVSEKLTPAQAVQFTNGVQRLNEKIITSIEEIFGEGA